MNFPTEIINIAKNIQLLLLDVDGVLTDGKIFFDNQGNELKAFNTLDGHGIKLLRANGIEVGIITGRESQIVSNRARDLGIHLIIQGREDKLTAMHELLRNTHFTNDQIAYVGDDHPDLLVMTQIALPISVANGHTDVTQHAKYITSRRGGEGAVREVCDLLLMAQDKYDNVLKKYITKA